MSVKFKHQYSSEPAMFPATSNQVHSALTQQSCSRPWSNFSIKTDQQQYSTANIDLNSHELKWLTKHFPTLSSDQLSSVLEEAQQQHGEAYNRLKEEQFNLQKQRLNQTIAQQQQNIVDRVSQKSKLTQSHQSSQNHDSPLTAPQQQQSKRKRTRAQFDRSINQTATESLAIQNPANNNQTQPQQNISSVETIHQQQQVDNKVNSDQQNQPITGAGQVEHYISEELIKGLMNSQSDEQRVQLCIEALEYSKKQIELPDDLKQLRCKNSMLKKGIRLQAENYSRESVKERQYDGLSKKLELAKKENNKLKQDLQLMQFTQQLQTQLNLNNKSSKTSSSSLF